uniref:Ig-like domain-containing protein n=1 Tax=Poecilia mexicana TaxID=48701 RepID=A0A3B3YVV0_9TELE
CFRSVSQHALGGVVEVNEGAESVLLPCIYSGTPPEDPFLIWTRSDLSPNSVHLRRENGDDLKNQNQRFRGRTSMNPDALDTGNFSLTLRKPEQDDGGNYSCSISDGREERNLKHIHLKVKAALIISINKCYIHVSVVCVKILAFMGPLKP